MNQLFKAETIEQFKISQWLSEQGVVSDDIAKVELMGSDSVRVTNPAGQYMIVKCNNGQVEIDQTPPDSKEEPLSDRLQRAQIMSDQDARDNGIKGISDRGR